MKIEPMIVEPMIVEPIIVEPRGSPPEFLQLFADQKASVGSTVKFEARILGAKPLKVNCLL